jgi:argininosuccinate lyase
MGVGLQDLPLADYQAIHPGFSDQLFEVFDYRRSTEVRNVEGGTASSAVRAQIVKARGLLSAR